MTISAPRYVSAPAAKLGRGHRILAIASREFSRRADWTTLLPVALLFTSVTLTVTVEAYLGSVGGRPTAASFEVILESPVWPLLVLIVTTSVGAGAIAEDVGDRTFTLYRSRPIELVDYLTAKTVAVGGWLLLATVGPGLAGIAVTTALGVVGPAVAVHAAGAFLVVGVIASVFFTGVAVALSSLTSRPLYAGVAIFGLVLSFYIGAGVVAAVTANPYVPYASPVSDLHAVAYSAFAVGPTSLDPAGAAVVLLGVGAFLWEFALWRLDRLEVIAE